MAAPSKAGDFWRLIVGVPALAFGCFLLGAAWSEASRCPKSSYL